MPKKVLSTNKHAVYQRAWRKKQGLEQKRKAAKWLRVWRKKNPERAKQHERTRYDKDREKRLAGSKAWRAANPERVKANARRWYKDRYTEWRYGLTNDQIKIMFAKQKGKCAICRDKLSLRKGKRFRQIDHCHTTGEVRSLLCVGCNTGFGSFKESPVILRRAIAYAMKHK